MNVRMLHNQPRWMLEKIFTPTYVDNCVAKGDSLNELLINAPQLFQLSVVPVRGNPELERVCIILKGDTHVQYFEYKKDWKFKDITNLELFNKYGLEKMSEASEKRYVNFLNNIIST